RVEDVMIEPVYGLRNGALDYAGWLEVRGHSLRAAGLGPLVLEGACGLVGAGIGRHAAPVVPGQLNRHLSLARAAVARKRVLWGQRGEVIEESGGVAGPMACVLLRLPGEVVFIWHRCRPLAAATWRHSPPSVPIICDKVGLNKEARG